METCFIQLKSQSTRCKLILRLREGEMFVHAIDMCTFFMDARPSFVRNELHLVIYC